VNRTLKALLLAVLFVGSGLLTFQIYTWTAKAGTDDTQLWLQLVTGLPFGVACSLRFMRERKWVSLGVALDCVTWVAAFRLALALAGHSSPYFGMAVAGMVGAIGVLAATGLGQRGIYRGVNFAWAGLIGGIAGLPFGLILNRSAQETMILALAFPLWQVAVGLSIARASE
jgi:hypothetical protein